MGNGHAFIKLSVHLPTMYDGNRRWMDVVTGKFMPLFQIIDTGRADSSNAGIYAIHYRGGTSVVVVDQNSSQKGWRSLGIYPFSQNAGSNGEYVELADYTGGSTTRALFCLMIWRGLIVVLQPTVTPHSLLVDLTP